MKYVTLALRSRSNMPRAMRYISFRSDRSSSTRPVGDRIRANPTKDRGTGGRCVQGSGKAQ
jgi:hypothetical protein